MNLPTAPRDARDGRGEGRNSLLSERETEVLAYVAAGYSNREIARELVLALGTVKTHIHNICGKLESSNRTQAVARAREMGLLDSVVGPWAGTVLSAQVSPNPFKGLRAFQEQGAPDFFGREALVERLLVRLREPDQQARFLAVIGASGSGKSSLVNAGLIPALRREAIPGASRWLIVDMMPGSHPFDELEAALLRGIPDIQPGHLDHLRQDERGLARALWRVLPDDPAVELLLVIDQFEEVFTQVENDSARDLFLKSLLSAVLDSHSRLRLIITLRSDYYDRPFVYEGFGDLLQRRHEVVVPMSPRELERAIVGPLERAGITAESGLVSTILLDLAREPGSLPLLQYALTELFEQQNHGQLTLSLYRASGGVLGALARRADTLYGELSADGQIAARQMFLNLVALGETSQDARRRVPWDEMIQAAGDEELARRIGRMFAKYRLLTFDYDPGTQGPVVEVAHEALLRDWARLRDWIEASRDDLRIRRQLGQAAAEWEQAGHDPSYLLHGTRLVQFETWRETTSLALAPAQRAYLQASIQERERQSALRNAQLVRRTAEDKRSRRRFRLAVGLLIAALVPSIVLAAVALNRIQVAQSALDSEQEALLASGLSEARARREAEISRSLGLAADARLALDARNTELAIALALAAVEIENPPPEASLVLSEAAYAPGARPLLLEPNEDRFTWETAFSADGRQALLALMDNSIMLVDLETSRQIRLRGHTGVVTSVSFSPDGRQALSSSQDGTLILWNLDNGAIVHRLTGHEDVVTAAAFGRDGRTALSGSLDRTLILWNLASGQPIRRINGHEHIIYSVAISPDGRYGLSGSEDATVRLLDLETGLEVYQVHGGTFVTSVAFSPDGRQGVGIFGGCIQVWDIATGQVVRTMACLSGDRTARWSMAISPDGRSAMTGSALGLVQVWDVATGEERLRLVGHNQNVNGLAFGPDGATALSASSDGSVRRWDLRHGAELAAWEDVVPARLVDGAIALDGRVVFLAVQDGTGDAGVCSLYWLDLEQDIPAVCLTGHASQVNALAVSPDGTRVLSGDEDGLILVWDPATGAVTDRLDAQAGPVRGITFSPDGRFAYAVSGGAQVSRTIRNVLVRWNVDAGQEVLRWVSDEAELRRLAVSPNGMWLLAGGTNALVVFDAQLGQVSQRLESEDAGPGGLGAVIFSPDGGQILSAASDATLTLWDAATGERIRRFAGHTDSVLDVDFGPGGTRMLSASADGTLILWDVASGQPLRRYAGSGAPIVQVEFAADGLSALSLTVDGLLQRWAISDSLADLVTWLYANRYVRELTPGERSLYGISEPVGGDKQP